MFLTVLAMVHLSQWGPLPTKRQLAWQAMETNAFVHFGPNTFTDVEWGGGKEDPNLFNPTDLDCDQWVRTFKSAGFKGVVFTAKHHDGFCLWPSKLSTHTVAQSKWKDGKGDVLGELAKACRKGGLKLGIYLSPWDRNHPAYGTPEYNKIFAGMLEEVLTKYGPIFEVWFDGANGEGPNGKKQVYDWPLFHETVRRLQPNAVMFSDAGPDVRWVGNEEGIGGETCWSTIPSGRYVPGTPYYAELTEGKKGGDLWIPAEVNTSIRPGWFYHADQDTKVRTPDNLMTLFETSVGRNGVLLLNVPPDRRGHIADPDVAALKEFGRRRKAVYGKDLAKGAERRVETYDGPLTETTYFKKGVTFDRIQLREPIAQGQRVVSFSVHARYSDVIDEIAKGTTIGSSRILVVPRTTTDRVIVKVDEALAPPRLLPLRVFLADTKVQVVDGFSERGGRQAPDRSLVLTSTWGSILLQEGEVYTWHFDGVRGEVNIEMSATGEGQIEATIAGQTIKKSISRTGPTQLGKVAIVVGGKNHLTLRSLKGQIWIHSVRFRPSE